MIRKQLLMAAAASMLAATSFAQVFELSVKGTGNSTWISNPNISNDGDEQDNQLGWGYNYGAGFTFYFTKSLGIGADFLFNQHNAAFGGIFGAPLYYNYESKITLNTIDVPLMFKIKGDEGGGAFLELGAVYSMFNSINYHYYSSTSGTSEDADVKDKFASSGVSAMLGMGVNVKLNDRWAILTGLRFAYGLTDIKGVDGFGRDLSNSALYPLVYDKYESSRTISGGIFLGLAFNIGDVE